MKQREKIRVVGAGLAGAEAAWQLAESGLSVELIDMKPEKRSPAHHSDFFAELVCSNSLKSNRAENATGLLKEELRKLKSLLILVADEVAVPAGSALAVDREAFSQKVTEKLAEHPKITIVSRELTDLPEDGYAVMATGPLSSETIFSSYERYFGANRLNFFDAAAPIVEASSIDLNIAFRQSRYDKGEADYLNCPMDQQQYQAFLEALLSAEGAEVKDFDQDLPLVFEACMPIEVMAARGEDAIRFGPLRPVGLRDPRTGKRPYAVVQLRQDNQAKSLYNLVGFQTRLKFPEQKRVFSMIPGLEQAEFARYGVMHKNNFLCAPALLNLDFSAKKNSRLYFAGQLIGVEGYVPSIASGLLAALNLSAQLEGKSPYVFPQTTMLGALQHYVAHAEVEHFQPMNANFGLLPDLTDCPKKQRRERFVERARQDFDHYLEKRSH